MAMKKPVKKSVPTKKGDEPVRVATKRKPPAGSENPGKRPSMFTKSRNEEVADANKEGKKKFGRGNYTIDLNAGGFGIPRAIKKK